MLVQDFLSHSRRYMEGTGLKMAAFSYAIKRSREEGDTRVVYRTLNGLHVKTLEDYKNIDLKNPLFINEIARYTKGVREDS